jgi:hypothetical protein
MLYQDYTTVTHNATSNVTTVDSGHYQVRDPYTPSEHFLPYNRYVLFWPSYDAVK